MRRFGQLIWRSATQDDPQLRGVMVTRYNRDAARQPAGRFERSDTSLSVLSVEPLAPWGQALWQMLQVALKSEYTLVET